VAVAQAALDLDAEQVMALIYDGRLQWAFNLAGADARRCEVRILSRSLEACQQRRAAPVANDGEFAAVIKIIFPMVRPRPGVADALRARTIYHRLNIKHAHLYELVAAGLLKLLPGSHPRRGPTGSPQIEFASVIEFLRERRIT